MRVTEGSPFPGPRRVRVEVTGAATRAPAEALKQLARLVRPTGSLLITELCSHDQSWARTACGDLWLGFEQEDLARWADAAGLTPGESLYVGLKNGFQIQVRHFAKPDAKQTQV